MLVTDAVEAVARDNAHISNSLGIVNRCVLVNVVGS